MGAEQKRETRQRDSFGNATCHKNREWWTKTERAKRGGVGSQFDWDFMSTVLLVGAGMEGNNISDDSNKSEAHLTSAAAFVEGGIQDACDDACSICLEAFCDSDPSTAILIPSLQVTGCKHEFHLQCILEWYCYSSIMGINVDWAGLDFGVLLLFIIIIIIITIIIAKGLLSRVFCGYVFVYFEGKHASAFKVVQARKFQRSSMSMPMTLGPYTNNQFHVVPSSNYIVLV
ncbi:hypothetical protein V8G54_026269 [Vigna mungo]|uniref:RING-type E3 ubiquitin transferase n=1 Tax=Vigna mungo TaxID=3915 RepID=A0AAQ3N0H7_VIGMU